METRLRKPRVLKSEDEDFSTRGGTDTGFEATVFYFLNLVYLEVGTAHGGSIF